MPRRDENLKECRVKHMLVDIASRWVLKECRVEGMLVDAASRRVLKKCWVEGMLVDATLRMTFFKKCRVEGMLVDTTSRWVLKKCRVKGMLVDATSRQNFEKVSSQRHVGGCHVETESEKCTFWWVLEWGCHPFGWRSLTLGGFSDNPRSFDLANS